MQTQEFQRITFTVKAVEITLENYAEVAKWCGGTVEMKLTRMMNSEIKLPVVRIAGQGVNREKTYDAALGWYIVELNGSFRAYKPTQFWASFQEISKDGVSVSSEVEDNDVVERLEEQCAPIDGHTEIFKVEDEFVS